MSFTVYAVERGGVLHPLGGSDEHSAEDAILDVAKRTGKRGTFVAYDDADGGELTIR